MASPAVIKALIEMMARGGKQADEAVPKAARSVDPVGPSKARREDLIEQEYWRELDAYNSDGPQPPDIEDIINAKINARPPMGPQRQNYQLFHESQDAYGQPAGFTEDVTALTEADAAARALQRPPVEGGFSDPWGPRYTQELPRDPDAFGYPQPSQHVRRSPSQAAHRGQAQGRQSQEVIDERAFEADRLSRPGGPEELTEHDWLFDELLSQVTVGDSPNPKMLRRLDEIAPDMGQQVRGKMKKQQQINPLNSDDIPF